VRADLLKIEAQLNATFVQRADPIRVILLGAISRQNFMLIGPPGTAKTSVIDCFVRHVDMPTRFKALMGKFTQPEHITGVLDIEAFKAGSYKTVTKGMMTECALPILDETLKTSDGCMNSLLGILGPEREFQGARTGIIATGGATNWPEVDALSKNVEALYDRFLLRCAVNPVDRDDKDLRRSLYRAALQIETYAPTVMVSVSDLQVAAEAAADVEISDEIIDLLDAVVARLTSPRNVNGKMVASDFEVSDRRATQLQRVLRANAWLEGREEVSLEDFDVLRHGLWSKRKDIESIVTALETIDLKLVQELVQMIDACRTAYRSLASRGNGPAMMAEVMQEMKKVAYEVKSKLATPIFTKKGRTMVCDAMVKLRGDFNDLNERTKQAAGE
jgi:MoxR-like ATPase